MTDFSSIMRRIITADDADGQSLVIVDGPPSAMSGDPNIGGLFDILEIIHVQLLVGAQGGEKEIFIAQ